MLLTQLFETQTLVQTELSDLLQARQLIATALADPSKRSDYFDYLKHLRQHHGADYSTQIHQEASKLVKSAR